MSSLSTVIQLIGGVTTLSLIYQLYTFLHLHLRPSSLPKYHHGKPGSTWALVTGSSDGIGAGYAETLLQSGFNVVLHGRNPQKLSGVKDRLSKQFPDRDMRMVIADAGEHNADVDSIVSTCASLPGNLTILVNNVANIPGDNLCAPLTGAAAQITDGTINACVRFPVQLTQALLPLLKKNGPSLIINMGSAAGVQGLPYMATYSGSKAFNHLFSESLKKEMVAEEADVEVLGIIVGNVMSNSNTDNMPGITCSSLFMAQQALGKVGSGYPVVWGWWRHAIMGYIVDILPYGVAERETIKIVAGKMEKRNQELKKQ